MDVFCNMLAINIALNLMNITEEFNNTINEKCTLTIGIHTGDVVGTIIGTKRRFFRVFGDAVNTT